jgi:DNA-binding IclR family transcriptional regulator
MEARSEAPVNQSVERAARLMSLFTPEEPELTLAQLTERLGTAKATTHRYTLALRRVGLLHYDARRSMYSLGARVVELAATALAGLRIIKAAGPYMEGLVAELNETVVLSIWDGEEPVVVRVDDNTDRLVRIVVRPGSRLPLGQSAQGKVFCAFQPEAPRGVVPEDVLVHVRDDRLAVHSDLVEGIRAVATPVFQERELIAAMAIVGTTASVPDDPGGAMSRRLRDVADLLSAELGYLAPAAA